MVTFCREIIALEEQLTDRELFFMMSNLPKKYHQFVVKHILVAFSGNMTCMKNRSYMENYSSSCTLCHVLPNCLAFMCTCLITIQFKTIC